MRDKRTLLMLECCGITVAMLTSRASNVPHRTTGITLYLAHPQIAAGKIQSGEVISRIVNRYDGINHGTGIIQMSGGQIQPPQSVTHAPLAITRPLSSNTR